MWGTCTNKLVHVPHYFLNSHECSTENPALRGQSYRYEFGVFLRLCISCSSQMLASFISSRRDSISDFVNTLGCSDVFFFSWCEWDSSISISISIFLFTVFSLMCYGVLFILSFFGLLVENWKFRSNEIFLHSVASAGFATCGTFASNCIEWGYRVVGKKKFYSSLDNVLRGNELFCNL